MGEFVTWKMPKQGSMGMKGTLGVSGGSRSVYHPARRLGRSLLCPVFIRSIFQQFFPTQLILFQILIRLDDELQILELPLDLLDFFPVIPIGDHGLRTGILQTVFQRFGAKEIGQWKSHCPDFVNRNMGDSRFWRLRQDNTDTVSFTDPQSLHRVGQSVGILLNLPEGP